MLKFQSGQNNTRLFIPFTVLGCWIFFNVRLSFSKDSENLIWIFKDLCDCSVFNVRCRFVKNGFYILPQLFSLVKNFFQAFLLCAVVFLRQLLYSIKTSFVCQELFYFLFASFCNNFYILPSPDVIVNTFSKNKNRRRRDLNPRAVRTTYTLSRGASSATWVLLQCLNLLGI